ncbi:PD-(D/E)XK nuclease family protein [Fundicoccus sp. Sow4_D5]|uniref:PD-(D/E)XK nuclease family protein n=1 Tax=Fundicoccus sp. Sow4_D5 TaxID=3438782 RepID=UPI003F909E89
MPLQFITGELSVNKKRIIIEQIVKIKAQNPEAIIYYLVPEHLKFDMESYLLKELQEIRQTDQAAMIDIQVVSFTRLAWFMLPANLKSAQNLSTIGLSMLVRQILLEKSDQLIVYRGQIHYQGFVEKLVSLFDELFEGNIEPEDLGTSIGKEIVVEEFNQEVPNIEAQRLAELQLLYSAYVEAVKDRQLASYQNFDALSQFLTSGDDFNEHYLIVDHHYYFNAQQLKLLLDLIRVFQQVWIALPISSSQAASQMWHPLVQTQRETYQQIRQLCHSLQLPINKDWEINHSMYNFNESIKQVAEYFYHNQAQDSQIRLSSQALTSLPSTHHFLEFDSIQTELRHVSNSIHALVTEEGYRYRDILIVARDLDRYQPLVEPFFAMNQIPLFYDHAASMSQHPFMLWLEGLLNLKKYNWRYDDLMLVLKSELFLMDPVAHASFDTYSPDEWEHLISEHLYQISQLENILLANGYFGFRFFNLTFDWLFPQGEQFYQNSLGLTEGRTLFSLANRLREWTVQKIHSPLEKWRKDMTGAEAASWLYQLVDQTGVRQQLIRLRDAAIAKGDIDASRRHEQVWQVFSETLDEFYTLYETQTVDYHHFLDILFAGLKEGSYHIIPPTIDQITFSNVVSPQAQPFKICFVLGADDISLPQKIAHQSLLTQENRQTISEHLLPHQYLMNHNALHSNQEVFLAYQLLLNATERLYISYAVNVGSQHVKWSPYFEQLIKGLSLPVQTYTSLLATNEASKLSMSHFGRFPMQITPILQKVRHHFESQSAVSIEFLSLVKHMLNYQSDFPVLNVRPLTELIEATFKFNQLPEDIDANIALELFGKNLNLSVSKIEQYYQDPYSHFLLHGLKLQERQLFELNPAKTGDYFHEFLDRFMQELILQNLSVNELDREQFDQLFTQTLWTISEDPRFNLFDSQPRLTAIKSQMDRRLHEFLAFIKKQQSLSNIETLQTEAIFGLNLKQQGLDGFVYPLSSGGQLSISGKIDRIDRVNVKQQNYLQIIDYKSGNKTFDLIDAYYGLDLQVLTYLSVALKNYADHLSLGAFYQPIIHSYQKATNELLDSQDGQNKTSELHLTKNRLNGFVTVDPTVMAEVEPSIESSSKSLIYPVALKKDGNYNAYSVAFDENELKILLRYTHYMFKRAAEQIQAGKIELQPFLHERFTPALQAQFRVITGFDATQSYSTYRHKTIKKNEVIQMMKKELEAIDGEEETIDDI